VDGAKTDDIIDVYYRAKGEHINMNDDKDHPSVAIELEDPFGIGGEMIKWEMATAVSATVLGVDPFDEPNVAESKKNTAVILHARRGPRKPVVITPLAKFEGIDIISAIGIKGLERRRNADAEEVWSGFLSGIARHDFLALLCYCERNASVEKHLAALRQLIEKKYNIITLRGYGPRFLHSIGQLFKGGTQEGHFVVMEREYDTDYDIPGQNITFGRLIKAQAQGDIKAIHKRKRPLININLRMSPEKGLDSLVKLIESL
jgi:transaldolase/glucose-6-phosphate isomerase